MTRSTKLCINPLIQSGPWPFVTDAHAEDLLMEDPQVRSLNLLKDAAGKLCTEQSEAFRVCRPHIVAVYMMTFLLWVAILTFLCHDLHEELLKFISLW